MFTRRKVLLASASLPVIGAGGFPQKVFAQFHKDLPPNGSKFFMRCWDGNLLSAVNEGGLAGGPGAALTSNACTIGPWETFEWRWVRLGPPDIFVLGTSKNTFVTPAGGGGQGCHSGDTCVRL